MNHPPKTWTNPERNVYGFCDLSNIYVTLQNHSAHNGEAVRLHFANLNELMVGSGRRAAQPPLWVTSDAGPGRVSALCNHTARLDVDLHIRPRLHGRESGVDEFLLDAIDCALTTKPPSVLVIATGDGAGFHEGRGFLAAVHRARELGWAIELLAWGVSCHRALRDFAQAGHGYTDLSNHRLSITYVEHGRRQIPISFKRRAIAAFPQHRAAA